MVDAVFGIDKTMYAKPDARSMCAPLRWLRGNVADTSAIYIGDSPDDYMVARECGLPFIAVLSGINASAASYAAEVPVVRSLADLFCVDWPSAVSGRA